MPQRALLSHNDADLLEKISRNAKQCNGVTGGAMAVTGQASESTMRVGPLTNLPSVVRSLGYDPLPIFLDCDHDIDKFQNPDNRISFIQGTRLIEHSARVTGANNMGLLLGARACPSHLGIAGFLLRAAPSVQLALQSIVRNLDLNDNGSVLTLDIGQNHSTLRYSIVQSSTFGIEQVYDMVAGLMHQTLRSLCGSEWRASSICLERREPDDPGPYRKFFNARIYFDSTESSITFPSHFLKAVPPGQDALLFQFLTAEADKIRDIQRRELIEILPAALRKALLVEQFSSGQVAASLGIQERTMHRRLKDADTSFRQQLDAARKAASEDMLAGTNMPICDIAVALGYSESSGFTRAFQRWSGSSPSSWRRNYRNTRQS